ncbi:MAG: hypothetical protein MHM6MM_008489 [Cercozoa sp. M6MM]
MSVELLETDSLPVLHQAFEWSRLALLSDDELHAFVHAHLNECVQKIRGRNEQVPELITANELPSFALRAFSTGETFTLGEHDYKVAICRRLPGQLYPRNLPSGLNVDTDAAWEKEEPINSSDLSVYKGEYFFEVALVLFKVDGGVSNLQLAEELNPRQPESDEDVDSEDEKQVQRALQWGLRALRFKFNYIGRKLVMAVVHTRGGNVPQLLFNSNGVGLFERLSYPQDKDGSVHAAIGDFNFIMDAPSYERGAVPGEQQIDCNGGKEDNFPKQSDRFYPYQEPFYLSAPHVGRERDPLLGVKVSSFKQQLDNSNDTWPTRDTMVGEVSTLLLQGRRFYTVTLLPRRESGGTLDHMFEHAESTVLHKATPYSDHHPVYHRLFFREPLELPTEKESESDVAHADAVAEKQVAPEKDAVEVADAVAVEPTEAGIASYVESDEGTPAVVASDGVDNAAATSSSEEPWVDAQDDSSAADASADETPAVSVGSGAVPPPESQAGHVHVADAGGATKCIFQEVPLDRQTCNDAQCPLRDLKTQAGIDNA